MKSKFGKSDHGHSNLTPPFAQLCPHSNFLCLSGYLMPHPAPLLDVNSKYRTLSSSNLAGPRGPAGRPPQYLHSQSLDESSTSTAAAQHNLSHRPYSFASGTIPEVNEDNLGTTTHLHKHSHTKTHVFLFGLAVLVVRF